MTYFDNAATTFPKPQAVLRAMQTAAVRYGANPGRAGHALAVETAEQVYKARETVADFFELPQCENVIFTKNCTEALNTAIKGLAKRGGHFVCSDLEHNAVVRPLEALRLQGVCTWTAAQVTDTEEETVENFRKCLRPNTIAIVCTGASNVFGKTLPIQALASLAHQHGVLLVADAAQTAGILPISMQKDGIDFLCAPGHKGLYGVMGTGVLLCNCETVLKPLTEGGTGVLSAQLTQPETYPERLESGTLNVPGILAAAQGVRFVKKQGTEHIYDKEMRHMLRIEAALRDIEKIELYTDLSAQPAGYVPLLSFNVQGLHSEETAARLSEANIAVRAGLHCAGLAHKKYQTLERGTVRICPSVFTTEKDVNSLLNSIFKIAKSA
ncbi:MAG: aminotransferase class V-fold PLP-dependent enzyme [Candidatus Fimenecus sp.]